MKTFLIVIGSIFGVVLLATFAFVMWIGLAIEGGSMPDSKVVRGSELKPATVKAIAKLAPLRPGEKIEYFYSQGVWSFEEDGNMITNERIVSYYTEEGVFWLDEVDFEEIESIEPEYSDTWLEDTFVWINRTNADGFYIVLSIEEEIDHEVIGHLRNRGIKVGPVNVEAEAEEVVSP